MRVCAESKNVMLAKAIGLSGARLLSGVTFVLAVGVLPATLLTGCGGGGETDWFDAGGNGAAIRDLPKKSKGSSGFVNLPRNLAYTQRFHTTVIHEFFHVLQLGHNQQFSTRPIASGADVREGHWFVEASAVWASAHFDRTLAPWENGRAAYADAHTLFHDPFQVNSKGLNATFNLDSAGLGPYSAYIWSYFVEQETGNPAFMRRIWAGLSDVTTFEQADDVIDLVHSFSDHFKTFALRNLNRAYLPGDPLPVEKRYVKLDDQFPDGVGPKFVTGDVPAELVADQPFQQSLSLEPLSSRYLRFTPRVTPQGGVKKVEFDFPGLQPQDLTNIQLLVRSTDASGSPQWVKSPFDESSTDKVVFCLSDGPTTPDFRGDFREIIIVVSNHEKRDKVSGNLVARPESKPCTSVWKGNVLHRVTGARGDVRTFTAVATWEFDNTIPTGPEVTFYRLASGNFNYEARIPTVKCTVTERGSGPLLKRPVVDPNISGSTAEKLSITNTPKTVLALFAQTAFDSIHTDCDGTEIKLGQSWAWGNIGPDPSQIVSADGNTIQGSSNTDQGDNHIHSEYLFTRSRE